MKALVLLSSLAPGGAERVTVSFATRMVQKGRAVSVCTVSSHQDGPLANELRGNGVSRHDLGAQRLADPMLFVRYLRLLRRGRYDIVHAHGQDAAILASWARHIYRAPLVITRHVLAEPTRERNERRRADAALAALRRADSVVAVSAATAESLARMARVPRNRVQVIHNGIDLERFATPDPADPDARLSTRGFSRAALRISTDAPVLLMPAVLRPGKGHDVLLNAMPAIRAQLPDVRLLIAGAGPLDGMLRERARGLGESVQFLGHREDIPALLEACDLVVLPSESEALPTALMEAAAASRPAIATRVGGVDEVVTHGSTGLLVPRGDSHALAQAVVTLMRDAARRLEFGRAARALAMERFGADAQARRTWSLWKTLVHGEQVR